MDTDVQTEGEGGRSNPRLNVKLDDKGLMVGNQQEEWRRRGKKTCFISSTPAD